MGRRAAIALEKVRELKRQEGKKIWLVSGSKITNTVRPEIDELIVKLHPVVAGSGICCSPESSHRSASI